MRLPYCKETLRVSSPPFYLFYSHWPTADIFVRWKKTEEGTFMSPFVCSRNDAAAAFFSAGV